MEFVEAMGIMKRMCKHGKGCYGCKISELRSSSNTGGSCMYALQEYPEETEAILAKWDAEHPVKTLKSVFNEAFPNAAKRGGCVPDIPAICVSKIGYTPICQSDECCEPNCIKCWNQPYDKGE